MQEIYTTIIALGSFPFLWILVIFLVGKLGSWRAIADKFPFTSGMTTSAQNERRSFQSIRVGVSNYSGVTNFESSPYGLHISVFILFKPGHPDMLIPWQELRLGTSKWPLHTYKFEFESLLGKSFATHKTLGEWIIQQKKQFVF